MLWTKVGQNLYTASTVLIFIRCFWLPNSYYTVLAIWQLLVGLSRVSVVWSRPLPNSKTPQFQNEAKCKTFLVKMSFICMGMKNHFDIKG